MQVAFFYFYTPSIVVDFRASCMIFLRINCDYPIFNLYLAFLAMQLRETSGEIR